MDSGTALTALPAARPRMEPVVEQFLRYLVVGGAAFVADLCLLLVLTEILAFHYLASAAVAFCCGLALNYFLSVKWVFSTRCLANKKAEFAVFSIIGVAGLGWTELLMYAGAHLLRFDYRLVKLVTVAIVLMWNFGARKLVLFSEPAR